MTADTEQATTRCVACGNYNAYRQGLCWGCHNAVERFSRELHNTRAEPATEDHKEKTS